MFCLDLTEHAIKLINFKKLEMLSLNKKSKSQIMNRNSATYAKKKKKKKKNSGNDQIYRKALDLCHTQANTEILHIVSAI